MDRMKEKFKTGKDLRKHLGTIDKDGKEYDEIFKELKILWSKWTKDVKKYTK